MKLNCEHWNVRTISGFAGGHGDNSDATVTLEVKTKSNTVEEVREAVELLPVLVGALHRLLSHSICADKDFGAHKAAKEALRQVGVELPLGW